MDLMDKGGYFWKGFTVYCDDWYTSPTLFHFLQSRKTGAVGTVRLNRRHMPKDLKVERRRDVDFRSSRTGMLALTWMDSKQVSVLSTVHTSALALVERGWGPQVSKPQCIVDHNAGMKGVGLGEQLASSYPPVRRSIKWYKKLFFYLFDLATVNAHAIYRYLGHRRQQVDFRLDLGNAIIEEHLPDVDPYGPASLPSPPRLQGGTRHAARETPGRRYRRCLLCYRAGRRRMTRTMCSVCQVSLCTYGCFERYHTERRL